MSRQTCVDCGALSPPTETNYTLISAKYGWRLTRWTDTSGVLHLEWRCPSCWSESKRGTAIQKAHKMAHGQARPAENKGRRSTKPPAGRP